MNIFLPNKKLSIHSCLKDMFLHYACYACFYIMRSFLFYKSKIVEYEQLSWVSLYCSKNFLFEKVSLYIPLEIHALLHYSLKKNLHFLFFCDQKFS